MSFTTNVKNEISQEISNQTAKQKGEKLVQSFSLLSLSGLIVVFLSFYVINDYRFRTVYGAC